jgi:hypothetical protein
MQYADMTLEASEFKTRAEGSRRIGSFRVRVLQSPEGEMAPQDAVAVEWDDKDLQAKLAALDRRELDGTGLKALGRTLAALLLPPGTAGDRKAVRDFLALSLADVGPDAGLRLRLRLPTELAVIPWEYAYVDRTGGDGMDGFLALDPRIAIVRHEAQAVAVGDTSLGGDIKVVAAFASAEGLPELALDDEKNFLDQALSGVEGIAIQICKDATLGKLQPLLPGTGVFHFAGHGDFTREMGARPGTYTGTGFLAFADERVGAEQMAINLRSQGVRLAVLAGCYTGRRDGVSVWSGIAPALVKAQIQAVVANQYTIQDKCAIAFSRAFYQALAGGLPIERAMAAGRIAIYNSAKDARDWGVPVLYLRVGDGQLFQGAADPAARERSRQAAEVDISVRVSNVQAGGILTGLDALAMLEGKVGVSVSVGDTVLGDVLGAKLSRLEGGKLQVGVDVRTVGPGGKVVGAKLGTIGGRGPRKPSKSATKGWGGSASAAPAPAGAAEQPEEPLIEEALRLDVASPKSAVVNEPFDVVFAVRQPDTPVLAATGLERVTSAEGSVFRLHEDEVVRYRIEVVGADFTVTPLSYQLGLRPKENSRPVAFQVVASRPGKGSLVVNACQEDGALAARTGVTIEIAVAVAA